MKDKWYSPEMFFMSNKFTWFDQWSMRVFAKKRIYKIIKLHLECQTSSCGLTNGVQGFLPKHIFTTE